MILYFDTKVTFTFVNGTHSNGTYVSRGHRGLITHYTRPKAVA